MGNCTRSSLQVFDGLSQQAKELKKYCIINSSFPVRMKSSGSTLLVRLQAQSLDAIYGTFETFEQGNPGKEVTCGFVAP